MKNLLSKLSHKKSFSLKTQGISMCPFFLPGDLLTLNKTSFNKVKENDFVLCRSSNNYFIHRVIYKNDKYLVTRGDANYFSDGRIFPKNVIAKVVSFKRKNQIFNPGDIYLWQSTLYFQELIKVNNVFRENKIDYVFLKGLPIHLYLENNHPKRIYADCDLLIEKKDFNLIHKVLIGLDFRRLDTSLSKMQKALQDKETEVSYVKEVGNVAIMLDIHFEVVFMMTQIGRLEPLYPQKLISNLAEEFMKERKLISFNKQKFPILSDENLLIYLSLHLFHHNFRGIFRLDLINKVIDKIFLKKKKVNCRLRVVINKIAEYRLENFVYPTFLLLRRYYQKNLPKILLDNIQPQKNKLKIIKQQILENNIFENELRTESAIRRFKNLFFISPYPLVKKILVFLYPSVFYATIWAVVSRLRKRR